MCCRTTSFASSLLLALAAGCTGDPVGSSGDGSGSTGADGTTGAPTSGDPSTGGGPGVDSTGGSGGSGTDPTATDSSGGDSSGGGTRSCLDAPFINGGTPLVDHEAVGATIGSHCVGSNHQDITGVERVVFLGDSVSVGTRPTGGADFYRSRLADELVALWGLAPPDGLWKQANPITGQAVTIESGAFAACSEWGARNDDLMTQIDQCFGSPEDFDPVTLVVITMGGNDLSSITQDAINGASEPELQAAVDSMLAFHREAIEHLTSPGLFPNGVFVVVSTPTEFTDFTGEVLSCPAAGMAGFNDNPSNVIPLASGYLDLLTEYTQTAIDTNTDVVFAATGFCGHGFKADDATGSCYRGPDQETWFDFTCIHPNATGHAELASMFLSVISE